MGKKNVIKFESVYPGYPDVMVPSKTLVPEWYKNQKPDKGTDKSFKKCVPFLEAITSGYLIKLPMDIYVEQKEEGPYISWPQEGTQPIGFRLNDSIDNIPAPTGYNKDSFYWKLPVSFEIPIGYSALVTQPLNRFDLPFFCFSVIIDGGYTLVPEANMSFYLKEGFEGLIPQGTPIAQIIPIKNESWSAKNIKGIVEKGKKSRLASTLVYSGWYKNNWWIKKDYT